MEITRPTFMEINLNNFKHNINEIKKIVGNNVNIMPVIKASGYGTYINRRLEIINEFNIVAVATVDEGVELRDLGFEKEIFVLNQPFKDEIEKIIKYNLAVGVSSNSFIKKLADTNEEVIIHLEIGTGMGRTGIHPYKVEEFLSDFPKNIHIEGIYTHLSSADIDDDYTKKQLESFNIAVQKAKEILGEIKYIHSAASNAILNYPESHFNLVRPGIIIYGYPASETTKDKMNLKPVAKLKSKITFLKTVKERTSIGYSRSYITSKETRVATIPIGYADGYKRVLSNSFYVIINGKKAEIIGKICMDSFMVDVTDIENVSVGDEVILWDNENITLEEIAEKNNTINYEILSTVGQRVPRIFVDD